MKWMLGSDFHIPYHEPRYVDLWFQVMKWFKPDVVDYLGDISDQDCYSRFSDGRSDEFLNKFVGAEIEPLPIVIEQERAVRELYEQTRKMRPNAEIFSALGNHDVRVFEYVDKKMPAHLEAITPEALWGFDELKIDYIHYGDLPKRRYGDIYVHHGVSVSKNSAESVRNDIDSFGVSIVRGHSHRLGAFYKTHELRNETWRGFEIGHLTDINSTGMSYTNVHNWQPGFAIAHIESGSTATVDGYWPHIQLVNISPDYTCVVDGKKFAA